MRKTFFPALAERLTLSGIVRLTATSTERAFALKKNMSPHLVVLDVQLRLDIVRRLTLEYPHVPVIILTGIGKHLPGEEGLSLCACRCLMKPFQIEESPDAIKESLGIISLDTA
jgi:DNA-binding response OmpR family regulator